MLAVGSVHFGHNDIRTAERWEATFDADRLFFGCEWRTRVFQFEFFFGDEIVSDGAIVRDEAVSKIKVDLTKGLHFRNSGNVFVRLFNGRGAGESERVFNVASWRRSSKFRVFVWEQIVRGESTKFARAASSLTTVER